MHFAICFQFQVCAAIYTYQNNRFIRHQNNKKEWNLSSESSEFSAEAVNFTVSIF